MVGDATIEKAFLLKRYFLRVCFLCPGTVLGTEDLARQPSACLSAWKLHQENGRDRPQENRQIKQLQILISAWKKIKGLRQRITDGGGGPP